MTLSEKIMQVKTYYGKSFKEIANEAGVGYYCVRRTAVGILKPQKAHKEKLERQLEGFKYEMK